MTDIISFNNVTLDNVTEYIIEHLISDTRAVLYAVCIIVSMVISIIHYSAYWYNHCKEEGFNCSAENDVRSDTLKEVIIA